MTKRPKVSNVCGRKSLLVSCSKPRLRSLVFIITKETDTLNSYLLFIIILKEY